MTREGPMTTLEEVRARFARGQGLPFADALTELSILDALDEHGVQFRELVSRPVSRAHAGLTHPDQDLFAGLREPARRAQ